MNERIVASGKVASCLSKQYFAYALRREPGDESGDVSLNEDLAAPELALSEVFKQLSLHPSFRARKVGTR